jgi:hypothetical protein
MRSHETPSPTESGEGLTKALLVKQLRRLIRLRREYSQDLNPVGLRLLDRAISATYKDCVEYGAALEAEAIMAQHPVPDWDRDI